MLVTSPLPGWGWSWALWVRGGSGQTDKPGWGGWPRSPAPCAAAAARRQSSAASCWTNCAARGTAALGARLLKETAGCDLGWRRNTSNPHFLSTVQHSLLISAVVYEHTEIYQGLTHLHMIKLSNTVFLFKEKLHYEESVEERMFLYFIHRFGKEPNFKNLICHF